jgi:hypothetical protein
MSQYCSFDVQPSAQNNAPNTEFQGHLDQLCGNKEYEAKVCAEPESLDCLSYKASCDLHNMRHNEYDTYQMPYAPVAEVAPAVPVAAEGAEAAEAVEAPAEAPVEEAAEEPADEAAEEAEPVDEAAAPQQVSLFGGLMKAVSNVGNMLKGN